MWAGHPIPNTDIRETLTRRHTRRKGNQKGMKHKRHNMENQSEFLSLDRCYQRWLCRLTVVGVEYFGKHRRMSVYSPKQQISSAVDANCCAKCSAVLSKARRSSPVSIIGMEASLSSHLIDLCLAWHRLNVTRGRESLPPNRAERCERPTR